MKHPFVKIIIRIIVTIILTIALALNTGAIISMNKEKRLREQAEASINNLSESFNYMVEIDKMVDELYEECVWKNIDLTKIFINTRFVDEEYVGPTVFSDCVVVKYHGGIVEVPEEAENTTPELTTKIMGQGNNVKIIGNRDVKNVLNLTRMNSWIPLEVKVSNSQPLEEIEALLNEELPKIGKKIDKIVSGPYCYGVLGFDDNNIILSIMTECREEDYHHIQRELNKEMYNLFKNKKISVKNG